MVRKPRGAFKRFRTCLPLGGCSVYQEAGGRERAKQNGSLWLGQVLARQQNPGLTAPRELAGRTSLRSSSFLAASKNNKPSETMPTMLATTKPSIAKSVFYHLPWAISKVFELLPNEGGLESACGGQGQSWRDYMQVTKGMLAETALTCSEPKSQKVHYCFCHPLANIATCYYNLSRGLKGHMLLKRAVFRKLTGAVKSWQGRTTFGIYKAHFTSD